LGETNGLSSFPAVGSEWAQDMLSGHVRTTSFCTKVTSEDHQHLDSKAQSPDASRISGTSVICAHSTTLSMVVPMSSCEFVVPKRWDPSHHKIKYLLGASHGSSPESSRLGYPSCCHWPNGIAFIQTFTTVL